MSLRRAPMTSDAEAWTEALGLLDQALDLPADERAAWLAAVPDPSERVRPLLAKLLADRHAIEAGGFLNAGAAPRAMPAFDTGQLVGPYRLQRALGAGGMASVWLAERADGAHRRPVALKLPLLDPRGGWVAQRFEREREILSALTHPHIASVLDAGVDGAQPWLAMEFVDGRTIVEHCEALSLDVPARLRLYLQVLRAVQHAHAQLVIHRDIKPSNVMVDREGRVKLLDFGVAKLLQPDGATADTALTQWGGRAMTLQYASPEQVAGRPLGTASDVYSLGVLLYQLLAGRLPYVLKRDTAGALEDAILAAHVGPPSQHVGDAAQARALRGDVDTIVLKALQAQPVSRYASAEAFAQDIERHLSSQPILARPPSAGYRLRKLLQRHHIAAAAALAVTAAVVVGVAATLWQADVARAQAARAEAVQRFLASVLGGNDPQQAQGRELSARELLDRSAKRIDTEFDSRPELRIELHQTVAQIYISLGRMQEARTHIDSALALYPGSALAGSERHVDALFSRGEVLEELRDYDAGRVAAEEVLHFAAARFGETNRWAGPTLSRLSWIAGEQGQVPLSLSLGRQALEAQRRVSGERSGPYLRIANTLAHAHLASGDVDEARRLIASNYEIGPQLSGYETTDHLVDGHNLARMDFLRGDMVSAERTLRVVLPQMDRHLGLQHDRTVITRSLFAQVLADRGLFDEAVTVQRDNLAAVRADVGSSEEAVAMQALTLSKVLRLASRFDEGLPLAREGLAYFDRRYAAPTWYREAGRRILGELLLGAGQRAEGLRLIEQALVNANAIEGARGHPGRSDILLSLAFALRHSDRSGEALQWAGEACRATTQSGRETNRTALRCQAIRTWIAALQAGAEQRATARADFVSARDALLSQLPDEHPLRPELMSALDEIDQRPAVRQAAARPPLLLLH